MSPNHNQIDWLRLARSENVGPITFFKLIEAYKTADLAISRYSELRPSAKILTKQKAEEELAKINDFGAKLLCFFDEKYPQSLRELADAPPVITVKGEVDFLQRNSVAIVGARKASINSINFARSVAVDIGNQSIIVVSGLARGIDTAAHEGSLMSGTIGVIAGGIDTIYPSENAKLFGHITEFGVLVSEVPFGSPPKGENFIRRNRLISGLSVATIVIEAGLKSGSLATARFALEQGKEVFAVPGSPFDLRCKGSNRLIKEGATIFESVEDFLEIFPHLALGHTSNKSRNRQTPAPSKECANYCGEDIKNLRREIISKLSGVPLSVDELIRDLGVSASLVNIAVIELELENKVELNNGMISALSFD